MNPFLHNTKDTKVAGRTVFLLCLCLILSPGLAKGPRKVHPNYNMIDLGGSEKSPDGVGGLRFLPDGRLVVVEWGGTVSMHYQNVGETYFYPKEAGKIHLVSGVIEAAGSGDVEWKTIATGLPEPMGVEVLNGDIYIHQKGQTGTVITKWTEQPDGSWQEKAFASGWGEDGGYFWHCWASGLVYKDGYFHLNFSSGLGNGDKWAFRDNTVWPPKERGCWISVDTGNGEWKVMATGMRTNEDTWVGPWGNIWSDDNQGDWMPSNRHYYLKEGRHYGHYYGDKKEVDGVPTPMSPPAIYCTQNQACESPVGGWTLDKGIYAGQMLVAEHDYRGINRDFLEMINGEIQGAVFDFGNALREAPIFDGHPHRVTTAPYPHNDVIIFGCAGDGHGWVAGPDIGALVKLVPNGKTAYEMLAIRNMGRTGFELEFTQPVNVSQATNPGNYKMATWTENPVVNYGGGAMQNSGPIDVVSASMVVGSNNKKVLLTFRNGDLKTGSIQVSGGNITGVGQTVKFDLGTTSDPFGESKVKSASGDNLFDNTAFYTLNQFGPGQGPPKAGCMKPLACNYDATAGISCRDCCRYKDSSGGCTLQEPLRAGTHGSAGPGYSLRRGSVAITAWGAHALELVNVKGEAVYTKTGTGPINYHFHGLEPGIYLVKLSLDGRVNTGRITTLE